MQVSSAGTAFVAGLVTSVHCVGMCGPLACLICGGNKIAAPMAVYHLGRMLAYTALGAVAGAMGGTIFNALAMPAATIFGWVLVLGFLVFALGLDRVLTPPRAFTERINQGRARFLRLPVLPRAMGLGLSTPLLPCGPLYLVLGMALATGSVARGGEFMLAFAAGTLPLLLLAQCGWSHWQRRLSPERMRHWQRGIALVSAVIIALRLTANIDAPPGTTECLFCR